jgi:large subunit ribosomal protein L6
VSRTGKIPLEKPTGVDVAVDARRVEVKGPKGTLGLDLPQKIGVSVEGDRILVSREDDTKMAKSYHGLVRSLIRNMCEGVARGYAKTLEIQGVGFNAAVKQDVLLLNLGYPAPVEFRIPDGASVAVENGTVVTVSGIDNQIVGDVAARIRSFFPAEPYKGKGIRYRGENVRRKVGKKVA